jgi:hypothetical protein
MACKVARSLLAGAPLRAASRPQRAVLGVGIHRGIAYSLPEPRSPCKARYASTAASTSEAGAAGSRAAVVVRKAASVAIAPDGISVRWAPATGDAAGDGETHYLSSVLRPNW